MDFFSDLFWMLFVAQAFRQHVMKKEQEYIIKLNHEILDRLKKMKEI